MVARTATSVKRWVDAGFVCTGGAAAVAIPAVPLRLSLGGMLLLVAAVPWVRRQRAGAWLLAGYAWAWMTGCVFTGGGLPARALWGAGLLCSLPAAFAGVHRLQRRVSPLDMGVAIGTVLLLALSAGLRVLYGTVGWAAAAAVGLAVVYLALRGVREQPEVGTSGRVFGVALGMCGLAVAGSVGIWLFSLAAAKGLQASGAPEAAWTHARREARWARRLDVRWALAHALHRQAELHLAAGRPASWRAVLRQAVEVDPGDHASRLALLHDAVQRVAFDGAAPAPELLDDFMMLPASMVPAGYAERIARVSLHRRRWDAFARAWTMRDGGSLPEGLRASDLAQAGAGLYFAGHEPVAQTVLEAAIADGGAGRQAYAILYLLHVRAGRRAEAIRRLRDGATVWRPGERAYLASLRDGTGSDESGVEFEGTVRLLACEASPARVSPGGTLNLRFSWRLLAPLNPEWKVFVHVRETVYQGRLVQGDHAFDEVGAPVREWAFGARADYRIDVEIPADVPTGDYAVLVGLWDGRIRRRAACTGEPEARWRLLAGHRVRVDPPIRISVRAE